MLRLPTRKLPINQIIVGIFIGVATGSYIYNEPFKKYSNDRKVKENTQISDSKIE